MYMRLAAMPPALQAAALRALDAEAITRRSRRSIETIEQRERLLRGTQEVLSSWSRGDVSDDDAVAGIDDLISRTLEGEPHPESR